MNTLSSLFLDLYNQTSQYLPQLVAALLVLIIGAALAKFLRSIVVRLLEAARLSAMVKATPIGHFLENADLTEKVENLVGSLAYWLFMLVIIHTSVSLLGLEPLSVVLGKLIGYLPKILSALLVLFFGVLLAGIVESLVKGSIKTIDGHASRLFGKIASYLVMALSIMAALTELGIASVFITVLFIGIVSMIALGGGLAIGLGGQHLVRKMLEDWYKTVKTELKD